MPPMKDKISIPHGESDIDLLRDAKATETWREECIALEKQGVYTKLAERFSLQPNSVHLDLGSGLSLLNAELLQRQPNAHIVAVETNRTTMARAQHRLSQRGVSWRRLFSGGADPQHVYDPIYEKVIPRSWENLRGGVTLVHADVRNLPSLPHAIEGGVESTSVTFAGGSPKLAARELDEYTEEAREKFIDETVTHMIATATHLTKPGGRLLRADRFTSSSPDGKACIERVVRDYRQQLSKYWEVVSAEMLAPLNDLSSLSAILARVVGMYRGAYAVTLSRNNRVCTLDNKEALIEGLRSEHL